MFRLAGDEFLLGGDEFRLGSDEFNLGGDEFLPLWGAEFVRLGDTPLVSLP